MTFPSQLWAGFEFQHPGCWGCYWSFPMLAWWTGRCTAAVDSVPSVRGISHLGRCLGTAVPSDGSGTSAA